MKDGIVIGQKGVLIERKSAIDTAMVNNMKRVVVEHDKMLAFLKDFTDIDENGKAHFLCFDRIIRQHICDLCRERIDLPDNGGHEDWCPVEVALNLIKEIEEDQ